CVLFYANFEARQFRQSEISTEHLLLALFREDRRLLETLVPGLTAEWAREEIENRVPLGKARFRSKDVPLSATGKRALAYATEEAGRLGHKYIDFEHLLFALAREKDTLAAQILRGHGFDLARARVEFAQIAPRQRDANQWIRLVT
ncbi:MAG: ATP-dependent Clp protease ATP-binding subunit ClpC, partial [candidate division Zixibacteria bacterium]|nr:ATP-dependent Clp protease ATP-binding subunit ClpC [candidate division Zixibacteria bacterium]